MIRLFAAIALPEPVIAQLQGLKGGIPGARWQTPEQMHLTLRFIGDVEESRAQDIDAALDTIRFSGFDVSVTGVGHFGKPSTARALWAGLAPSPELNGLHDKIETGLLRAGLPPEGRKYTPHITLARLKGNNRGRLAEFVKDHQGLKIPPFVVDAFHLYSSRLSHNGAQYRIETTYAAR